MQTAYSKDVLTKTAADNYMLLRGYSEVLVNEGYWNKAARLLNRPVFDVLDGYVQACLTELCIFCETYTREEALIIAKLPVTNVLHVIPDAPLSDSIRNESLRIFNSPPTIIQLLGLRDREKGSSLSGMFFDALCNVMLSVAFIKVTNTVLLTKFMRNFLARTGIFVYSETADRPLVDERYILKKLCGGDLPETAKMHKKYEGCFEKYRDEFLNISAAGAAEKENIEESTVSVAAEKKQTRRPGEMPQAILEKKDETHEKNQLREAFFMEVQKKSGEKLDLLVAELDSLIGLSGVKNEVKSLINLIKVKKMREEMRLPDMEMSFHMVFTGSPGTGKTTVARLIASIYRELGLLTKGQLVETDRSGLVAGYVGQTALKVKDVVNKAIGGVLFIDEAYSLSNGTDNDFGREAIDTLVKLMEDHRDDLVVIVAGYTGEMQRFLKSNTGLVSRFNKFLAFPDYSDYELIRILGCISEKSGYTIGDDAVEVISEHLSRMTEEEKRRFGNARGIRNIFERLILIQANRVVLLDNPDRDKLTLITAEDAGKLSWE